MTNLTFETILLKAAGLGAVNPMPDLKNVSYIHAQYETTPAVTAEDKAWFGKGAIGTLLPYLSQDGYDRELRERPFRAAVLENAYMRAVFLPELGGRLWSLYHKKLNRELLYVNEIVQPCNLGLRNAWVAGGVEWNAGIKGHSPVTCETLFTARSENAQGLPILTMYEYERIRGTVFGINAMLEEDRLYIRTTVENLGNDPVYTYWWSNIAVPEKGVRVLTQAEEMFSCIYEDNHYTIDKLPAPVFSGVDMSYPERAPHAGDVFYITENTPKRWIASLESDGAGLLQYSTPELKGRKVFFWGQGTGGRNWNRWLTGSENAYIEIQAGLMHTQMEHIPIPGNTCWSWTECYTGLQVDGETLTLPWAQAGKALGAQVAAMPDPAKADIPLDAPKQIVIPGSGWGALETRPISRFYAFPEDSLQPMQKPWLQLREQGYLPETDPAQPPESYRTEPEVREALEKSLGDPRGDHWLTWLHIGIARYAAEDIPGAKAAWETSLRRKNNAWAWRNLAMLSKNEENSQEKAVAAMEQALALSQGQCRGLLLDAAKLLTDCGRYSRWLEIFEQLPGSLAENGRLQFFAALSHMRLGHPAAAEAILNEDFTMNDIKEGELSVSAVWQELYQGRKPLPDRLNFRMYERKSQGGTK